MVLIYDFFFLFRIFNANKKCVFVKFFGGIRGFLILTRDLNEIIMPAKENDIIFYFSFVGGLVVVFAKASTSCVRRIVTLRFKPRPPLHNECGVTLAGMCWDVTRVPHLLHETLNTQPPLQ